MNARYSLHTTSIWLSKHITFQTKLTISLQICSSWSLTQLNTKWKLHPFICSGPKPWRHPYLLSLTYPTSTPQLYFHITSWIQTHLNAPPSYHHLSRKLLQQTPNRCIIHPLHFYINLSMTFKIFFKSIFFYLKNIKYSYVLCLIIPISVIPCRLVSVVCCSAGFYSLWLVSLCV